MVFELRKIYKDYLQGKEAVPVLKDISMSVDEGEYVAIMGPSGSGKSTLMNIIGCLDKQTKGSFIFDGADIMECSDKQLSAIRNQKIGFVFQNFNLMPRQSALENVELPLLYAGVSKKKRRELAKEALKRVGLEDRMSFKPTQLSGGQKQRVAIARAIVNKPKLLLADEPTGALDTKSGDQVMELFKELNDDGMTIVMITHEPDIAKSARKIMYIRDGELHDGAFDSRHNPAAETVLREETEMPRISETAVSEDVSPEVSEETPEPVQTIKTQQTERKRAERKEPALNDIDELLKKYRQQRAKTADKPAESKPDIVFGAKEDDNK